MEAWLGWEMSFGTSLRLELLAELEVSGLEPLGGCGREGSEAGRLLDRERGEGLESPRTKL